MQIVGHFEFDRFKNCQGASSSKTHIFFIVMVIKHGLSNTGYVKIMMADRRNQSSLIVSKFLRMHPLLKCHILFYSNGLAIQHSFIKYQQCESK